MTPGDSPSISVGFRVPPNGNIILKVFDNNEIVMQRPKNIHSWGQPWLLANVLGLIPMGFDFFPLNPTYILIYIVDLGLKPCFWKGKTWDPPRASSLRLCAPMALSDAVLAEAKVDKHTGG